MHPSGENSTFRKALNDEGTGGEDEGENSGRVGLPVEASGLEGLSGMGSIMLSAKMSSGLVG